MAIFFKSSPCKSTCSPSTFVNPGRNACCLVCVCVCARVKAATTFQYFYGKIIISDTQQIKYLNNWTNDKYMRLTIFARLAKLRHAIVGNLISNFVAETILTAKDIFEVARVNKMPVLPIQCSSAVKHHHKLGHLKKKNRYSI